ncbi:MAG: glycosyl hydrolase [Clostridiales bacterium]|nr:glycosyl hydrolase [Clostridiales bacterium]
MKYDDLLMRVKRAALAFQRHDWEQGVTAQAFLESGDADTAIALAATAALRQGPDGRLSRLGSTPGVTDPCAVGEALLLACAKTQDLALIEAKDRLLRWALSDAPRSSDGIVYHLDDALEFWVDSMYMLPPFLAQAGHYAEAVRQSDGLWAALYLPEKGLLGHRYDEKARRFVRRDAWGVGNGWALNGMARVARALPPAYRDNRRRLVGRMRGLLDAVLRCQRADGRFHDVLDDPSTFPEVNLSQMAARVIYEGVAEGWLDDTYLPRAELCRNAAIGAVDGYGIVRGACGLPDFTQPGAAPEAQAFFIMMEAARERLRERRR